MKTVDRNTVFIREEAEQARDTHWYNFQREISLPIFSKLSSIKQNYHGQ